MIALLLCSHASLFQGPNGLLIILWAKGVGPLCKLKRIILPEEVRNKNQSQKVVHLHICKNIGCNSKLK